MVHYVYLLNHNLMKRFFILLAVLGIVGCASVPKTPVEVTYSIDAFDVVKNQMQVTFEITNNTTVNYTPGNWELHWNQMGGSVATESLPEGISFEWVNGAYYFIFSMGDAWALAPGETLRFSYTHNGIMERLVMGPRGVFLVQDGEAQDAEVAIKWKDAKGVADLQLPSAMDRYQQLEGVSLLDKSELQWVVPSPKVQSEPSAFRAADTDWTVALASEFSKAQGRLKQFMTASFSQNLQWDTAASNFKIQHNAQLKEQGYKLQLQEDAILLEAASYAGVIYGLQSLRQIIQTATLEASPWPLLTIEDAPRFQYRGFLLDISRNFYSVEKIKQLLDLMSLFKLNALDFKLADDEGWRIEIPGLEELTEVASKRGYTTTETDQLIPMYGSGAHGGQTGNGFISREEFIDLLQYAHARNIQIMPQISFPSHARAAIKAMDARYKKFMTQGDKAAAEKYLLIDPEDQSDYRSAQLYNDNIICICRESAYTFFEKVVQEMVGMYKAAEVPLQQFSIGADELPYGSWRKSPLCDTFIKENTLGITSIDALYEYNLKRLKGMFDQLGVRMAGWEDIMLDHSEKSQSETQIRKENFNFEVIPYVWNNTWKGGREDMIYKFANRGFQTVMSNSSAFYFDMTDDNDIENYGLDWSGYVNYKDAWGTDPENVFANFGLIEKHGISPSYLASKEKLDPLKRQNLIGIQGQLWTETVISSAVLDELVFPNMLVLAERAWQQRPAWLQATTAEEQKPAMQVAWNHFSNQLGQRSLPLMSALYPSVAYDLPKPGGVITQGKLNVRQKFPGLTVRYTTDGSNPTTSSPVYTAPVVLGPEDKVILRSFDANGRGGRSIQVNQ